MFRFLTLAQQFDEEHVKRKRMGPPPHTVSKPTAKFSDTWMISLAQGGL
jgi:hypothetical protein